MGSVNKVILVGNLGRDAEVRFTPSGAPVASFSIATTENWTSKLGMHGAEDVVRQFRGDDVGQMTGAADEIVVQIG